MFFGYRIFFRQIIVIRHIFHIKNLCKKFYYEIYSKNFTFEKVYFVYVDKTFLKPSLIWNSELESLLQSYKCLVILVSLCINSLSLFENYVCLHVYPLGSVILPFSSSSSAHLLRFAFIQLLYYQSKLLE